MDNKQQIEDALINLHDQIKDATAEEMGNIESQDNPSSIMLLGGVIEILIIALQAPDALGKEVLDSILKSQSNVIAAVMLASMLRKARNA